ncbi:MULTISPECIES: porin [unclassified Caballeronia]|uniref:porin n=1 Tax=unclassified Caballeronia TaxID=2646786 RepID=UPI002027D98A|nr:MULTISPECIES: porin [unclassified Caballeronia]
MKRTLFAALAASACAGTAYAQSSVTLYGIVDAGFRFNSNAGGHPSRELIGGNQSANRFGLIGAEDLGGGLKAIFTLENGFNIANGTLGNGGLIFGRQAFVGLSGNFGTVALGRQYPTLSQFLGPFEAASDWGGRGSGFGYHPGGLDDVDGTQRANNALKFTSVNYAGLRFGGTYSLGGVPGSVTQNEIISLGLTYNNGPFAFAAAYLFAKNPNYSLFGGNGNSNTPASTNGLNVTSPVFSGYASAASQRVLGAGVSYQIERATVGALFTSTQLNDVGGTRINGAPPARGVAGTSPRFNTGELNLKYQYTPSFLMGVSYAYTRSSSYAGQTGASYQQWIIGADYLLSKRTDLYIVGLHQKAAGIDSTGKTAVAAMAFAVPSTSNEQSALMFGIRHTF